VSERNDLNRAQQKRYKEDVKRRGKSFYPYAMFEDTVMSLVVVAVIIALAIIWKYTDLLGVKYAAAADPGTFQFVPRPDWYFYFLFYLLRIFKWPPTVFLGTIGVPTIGLVLLLAMPFLDTRRERRLSRRPVAIITFILVVISMGTLTWKGATAKEATGGADIHKWQKDVGFSDKALPGADIVSKASCLNCHTYDGDGTTNLGAPDLTDIAKTRPLGSPEAFAKYVSDPSKFNNTVMPKFGQSLTQQQLLQVGQFLSESTGKK
jgi:ubiquinol-cytochrome c reductase cytochrome b subunit/menaquinol-cytochrome c reductase cytochrome b/c subunit